MRSNISFAATAALLATSASAATIKILVGSSGLSFSPNSTTAAVGDELEFHFYPKKHNVVQGSFDAPCATGSVTAGFYSGFVPSTSGEATEVFTVKVNDTKPIWYYCSQQTHCQSGMVGVVNPPTSGANTLDAYKSAAAGTSSSTTPGSVSGGTLSANSAASSSGSSSGTATSSGAAATGTNGAENLRALKWAEMIGGTVMVGAVAGFML